MTVVVGYLAGRVGPSALHLAVRAARTLDTSLTVATILTKPWLTPPLAKGDYSEWAGQVAEDSGEGGAPVSAHRGNRGRGQLLPS